MRGSPARQCADRQRGILQIVCAAMRGRSADLYNAEEVLEWMRKRTHSIEDGYWLLKQYPCSHATAEGPSPLFSHFIIRTSRRFKFQVIRRRLWRKCVVSVRKGTVQLRTYVPTGFRFPSEKCKLSVSSTVMRQLNDTTAWNTNTNARVTDLHTPEQRGKGNTCACTNIRTYSACS